MSFRSFAATVSLALAVASASGALGEEPSARTLSVVGEARVDATPDLAVLLAGVETTARTAEEAASTNAAKSARVVTAVRRLLAPEDTVATTNYTLSPQYVGRRPGSEAPPEISGYVARNDVRVAVHDLAEVGGIIDAVLAAGANRVRDLEFRLEDRSPYVRQALSEAGKEARLQAESVATALGVTLGRVLSTSTSTSPYMPAPRPQMMALRVEGAVPTPIEAGEVEVRVTLHVTYEIE